MKNTTKSGLIVLILIVLGVAGYSVYTITKMDKKNSFQSVASSGSYRVGEDADSYDPSAAKAYKSEFIADNH